MTAEETSAIPEPRGLFGSWVSENESYNLCEAFLGILAPPVQYAIPRTIPLFHSIYHEPLTLEAKSESEGSPQQLKLQSAAALSKTACLSGPWKL